jgi:hypothetical protein
VGVPAKKLQLRVYGQFSAQENFQAAAETVRGSHVAEAEALKSARRELK